MKEIRQILNLFKQNNAKNISMALATVVNIEDSSYRRVGARMLILENGVWIGGISGGCLEGDVLKHAKRVMLSGIPQIISYDTRGGDPYQIGVGLGCEGKIDIFLQAVTTESGIINKLQIASETRKNKILITPFQARGNDKNALIGKSFFASDVPNNRLFLDGIDIVLSEQKSSLRSIAFDETELNVLFEWIEPNIKLILAGDNYDIYPMSSIANEMGWDLEIIGKPLKIQKNKMDGKAQFHTFDELKNIQTDSYTAIISMAHDFDKDRQVIKHFSEKQFGYLGVLGPRKRFVRMCNEENWTGSFTEKIHNPIGLDIGSSTPEEIALSVIAEITNTFRKGKGVSLTQKAGDLYSQNKE